MITGFHSLIYSDDPEVTRAFFRDVLGWPYLDAHGGWLIFKTPPSDIGVHPSAIDEGTRTLDVPYHQLSLMCDDLEETIAELAAKGVEIVGEIEDQGYGIVCSIAVPAAGTMLLYQPRHPLAYELEG
jgi:catechol 2,3-dioxygenase-like lactoylglutathione lyase family enzyme